MSVGNPPVERVRGEPRFTATSEMLAEAHAFARDAHAGQRQQADGTPYLAGCSQEEQLSDRNRQARSARRPVARPQDRIAARCPRRGRRCPQRCHAAGLPRLPRYRSTLGLLDDVAESLPLVPLLREELEKLDAEHAWQRRLQTIEALFDGFNRRKVELVLELCDPQVEWPGGLTAGSANGAFFGHEGVRRYFADLAARWSWARGVVYRLTPIGDQILVVCGVGAKPHDRGPDVRQLVAVVFAFRDDKVLSLRMYRDPAAAGVAAREPRWVQGPPSSPRSSSSSGRAPAARAERRARNST
jgi:ketosteroid isomerase-like protein